jgi:hypothetical protein
MVMVELCRGRVDILKYDEEFLMREVANINFQKIRMSIKHVSLIKPVFHAHILPPLVKMLNIFNN